MRINFRLLRFFTGARFVRQKLAACVLIVAASTLCALASAADEPPAATPQAPTDATRPPVAVYLLPLDDFSFDYADRLARALSADLKINVRASYPMGAGDLAPFPGRNQYSADEIIENAYKVGLRLSDRTRNSAVIALTGRDINDKSLKMRFVFALHDDLKLTSVVSAARMRDSVGPPDPAGAARIYQRIYKMVKRTIGVQYLKLPRSSNISDIMYSPIMSLKDLDDLGSEFVQNWNAVVTASLCELTSDPQRFSGRIVRFQAEFLSDAKVGSVLISSECRNNGGVVPLDQNKPTVSGALSEALGHGCPGTLDKIITAIWTGKYHWEPENRPGSGKFPRWLEMQKIEDLEVKPRATSLSCPDKVTLLGDLTSAEL